jgi:hypothetical protein
MLKITAHDDGSRAVLELEGSLAGPWVDELKECWERMANGNKPITAVLKEVSYVDDAGRRMLTEMHRRGVEFVAGGCMISAIIDEIQKQEQRNQ